MTGVLRRVRGMPVLLDVGTDAHESALRATSKMH